MKHISKRLTATQKNQVMTKLLNSPEGRKRIAKSVVEPLRRLRDYESSGRSCFLVDELPDGALPIYDKDVDIPAYVVAEEGDNIEVVVNSKRIIVPLFELAANPTIPFVQAKERRFDVIKRIKDKTKAEIFEEEDRKLYGLIQEAGGNNTINLPKIESSSTFDMEKMADAFAELEQWGLMVDKVLMNGFNYKTFRKAGRDFLDFETQKELIRSGKMANLWGATIQLSRAIAKNTISIVAEPEYLGIMPLRIDLTVIPADKPGERKFGWSVFENLGATVHNLYGLQTISLT